MNLFGVNDTDYYSTLAEYCSIIVSGLLILYPGQDL